MEQAKGACQDDQVQNTNVWEYVSYEKLYNREGEVHALHEAYGRVVKGSNSKSDIVVITGETGSGKTSVAHSLYKRVHEQGGYFLVCKFDQSPSIQPHSAFVGGLTTYAKLVEEQKRAKSVKDKILGAIGDDIHVLTEIVPALEKILGKQTGRQKEDQPTAQANNRFKNVFRMFLQAVSSLENPLVLVLDDLHNADESSMDLLRSLLCDTDNKGVLFIATYRRKGDSDADSLSHLLSQVSSDNTNLKSLHLGAFDGPEINDMLAGLFDMEPNTTRELANFLHGQTRGNLFFIKELVRVFHAKGFLRYEDSKWTVDMQTIRLEVEYASVHDLVRSTLEQLPVETKDVLKIASCLGAKAKIGLLRRFGFHELEHHLEIAVNSRLLIHDDDEQYRFVHDCIQETIHRLIPYDEYDEFHYRLGRRLWISFDLDELDRNIFVVVGLLKIGRSRIKGTKERQAVAKLCLCAGEHATSVSSFQTSYNYVQFGLSLLHEESWVDCYELCLQLHIAILEVAYCTGHFDEFYQYADSVFKNARAFEDTFRAHYTMVSVMGSTGRIVDATNHSLKVLQDLGVSFPREVKLRHTISEFKKTQRKLRSRSYESILRLPPMTDKYKLAAMQLMGMTFLYAFFTDTPLFLMMVCRMVSTTIDFGICAPSSLGFAIYAGALCDIWQDIDDGTVIGRIALDLSERLEGKAWMSRTMTIYFFIVHGWKSPSLESVEPLKRAHDIGMMVGDIEVGLFCRSTLHWTRLNMLPFSALIKDIEEFSRRMIFYGQETNQESLKPSYQLVLKLTGKDSEDPKDIRGTIVTEAMKLDREDDDGRGSMVDLVKGLQYLVIDEADRLLGRAFEKEVEAFLDLISNNKNNKELSTWLFSATFPKSVEPRVDHVLRRLGGQTTPLRLKASNSDRLSDEDVSNSLQKRLERTSTVNTVQHIGPASTIKLRAIRLEKPKRTLALRKLLEDNPGWDRVLVFVATRYTAEHVARKLRRNGIESAELHGKLDQEARMRRLREFSKGSIRVLLATDVASRGLDVEGLPAVVNYDLPRSTADFVHRVGRTGRAGKKGDAISFVTPTSESQFDLIETRHLVEPIEREVLPGFEPAEDEWEIQAATTKVSAPGTVHSSKGLAHDRMYGGIKGHRKSKKDRLREKAAREAASAE